MITKMEDAKFFNFPIRMLSELSSPDYGISFLNNVLYYHIVSYADNLENFEDDDRGNKDYRINSTCNFFNVRLGDKQSAKRIGNELLRNYADAKVFTGINTAIFWDFFKSKTKTQFDWQCLITFLSLKSILGHKKYAKTNNKLLYARMTGHESTADYLQGEQLKLTRYRRDKIFGELQDNWNLVYYSNHNKGFYFSFNNKISFEDLIFEAEKRRKSTLEKIRKKEKQDAILKARQRLERSAQ